MGLGLNGGGEASVRFFLKYGAFVTATDMKTAEELAPTIASLESDTSLDTRRLRFVLGRHDIGDFEQADVVIKNPGVKFECNKYLAAAKVIETDIAYYLYINNSKAFIVDKTVLNEKDVESITTILKTNVSTYKLKK